MHEFLGMDDIVLCEVELENDHTAKYKDLRFLVARERIIEKDGKVYLKGRVSDLNQGSAEITLDTGCLETQVWACACLTLKHRNKIVFLEWGRGDRKAKEEKVKENVHDESCSR